VTFSVKKIRRIAATIRSTRLHSRWLLVIDDPAKFRFVRDRSKGIVLDIGCASRWPENVVPRGSYVALDNYRTGKTRYGASPDVFCDAASLPFRDGCIGTVLLLDVLEHLKDPVRSLVEVARILEPGGRLLLQVPFLYPLHDEPFDFRQWTAHCLQGLATEAGLLCDDTISVSHPVVTAAVLANVAMAITVAKGLAERGVGIAMLPIAVCLVPVNNIVAWLLSMVSPVDALMPTCYRAVFRKVP
jgi:SAM-dependent methyltransferase